LFQDVWTVLPQADRAVATPSAVLEFPTISFFFVSTEIHGWPALREAFQPGRFDVLELAFRSETAASFVLRVLCRLLPTGGPQQPTDWGSG